MGSDGDVEKIAFAWLDVLIEHCKLVYELVVPDEVHIVNVGLHAYFIVNLAFEAFPVLVLKFVGISPHRHHDGTLIHGAAIHCLNLGVDSL